MDGEPAAHRHGRRPALVVLPRRLLAVAAVDETEVERRAPAVRHRRRVADDADHARPQARPVHGGPPEGQGVDAAGGGVHQAVVVVLPTRLVLLGPVVVVQAEQHGAGLLGRRPEVDAGLPAPRPDLHECAGGGARLPRPAGSFVQGDALVVGHEPVGGAPPRHQVRRPVRLGTLRAHGHDPPSISAAPPCGLGLASAVTSAPPTPH